MRTESEMKRLILSVAERYEQVRMVFLNGSRANPNAERDIFQDYDVVYLVTDVSRFQKDPEWFRVFGEELIFQFPDDSALFPEERRTGYAYLMQFADGARIDLTLRPVEELEQYLQEDSQTILWLDKDGIVPSLPAASDRDYWIRRPTEQEYLDCCNEFYWVSLYVAKGLCRQEILFAQDIFNSNFRPELLRMLSWKAGLQNRWSVSIGKSGKYLNRFLPTEYERFLQTYPAAEPSEIWKSLFCTYKLFEETAWEVGKRLDYIFPEKWAADVPLFAAQMKGLSEGTPSE